MVYKMLFSIVVPVYKIEQYIDDCICSILNQTYQDFELILVDDGSPDNCPKICDEYAKRDSRIKVIHKQNGGLISARQAGADVASGEYIVIVDGDDKIDKNYLQKFAYVIDNYHPDIACCGYYELTDTHSIPKHLGIESGYYNKNDIQQHIYPILVESKDCKSFPSMLWAKALKREIYAPLQSKVSRKIVMGEDVVCTKPCIYHSNSLYVIDEPLYYYRYNQNSLTKSKSVYDMSVPKMRGLHLEMYMDKLLFERQIYRSVVRSLFNAIVSQFNKKQSYWSIKKEIKNVLKDEYYTKAVKNADFTSKKGKFALYVLKYKLIFVAKLYSMIKYR